MEAGEELCENHCQEESRLRSRLSISCQRVRALREIEYRNTSAQKRQINQESNPSDNPPMWTTQTTSTGHFSHINPSPMETFDVS